MIGTHAIDNIASSWYNWAPRVHHQSLWRLRTLHSKKVHTAVPKWSFTLSVFAISCCIHLQKCACNVWQIWFFACRCRVNIYEPRVSFTISLLSAVSQIGLPSCIISTAMLESESWNTSLLQVMVSSKNNQVLFHDVCDHSVPTIVNAWWAFINVSFKRP